MKRFFSNPILCFFLGVTVSQGCSFFDSAEAETYTTGVASKTVTIFPCPITIDDEVGVSHVEIDWLTSSESSSVSYKQEYVHLDSMEIRYIPIPFNQSESRLFTVICGFKNSSSEESAVSEESSESNSVENYYYGGIVRTEIE